MQQGQRIHAVQTNSLGEVHLGEGHYGIHEHRGWHARPPGLEHACDISGHTVIEHKDFSITVGEPMLPTLLRLGGPQGSNGPMFVGHLVRGYWCMPGGPYPPDEDGDEDDDAKAP